MIYVWLVLCIDNINEDMTSLGLTLSGAWDSTYDNGGHLFIPISAKLVVSGTKDDDVICM